MNTLQSLFAAKSSAHVVHTKFQLATLKKGPESTSNYHTQAKSLATTLSAARHRLSDSEFSICLLVGLGFEYESLVIAITTHLNGISPHQLYNYRLVCLIKPIIFFLIPHLLGIILPIFLQTLHPLMVESHLMEADEVDLNLVVLTRDHDLSFLIQCIFSSI